MQNFKTAAQTLLGETAHFGFCPPKIGIFRGLGGVTYGRPGVVLRIMPRGHFIVKFVGDLLELDCTKANMMPFQDYEKRKWRSKAPKMFTIPDGQLEFFRRCVEDAKEKADK